MNDHLGDHQPQVVLLPTQVGISVDFENEGIGLVKGLKGIIYVALLPEISRLAQEVECHVQRFLTAGLS